MIDITIFNANYVRCLTILLSAIIAGFTHLIIELINRDPPCDANPCCVDGPSPLCCVNGVCSNPDFVFTGNKIDECQCLCVDNWEGWSAKKK